MAEETLVAFYRRVRPYGAWSRVAEKCGMVPESGLGRMVVSWLAGTVMVLGGTFSAGKFLLGEPFEGAIYLAVALIGAAIAWPSVFGSRAKATKEV